jgi:hypothetical protein
MIGSTNMERRSGITEEKWENFRFTIQRNALATTQQALYFSYYTLPR